MMIKNFWKIQYIKGKKMNKKLQKMKKELHKSVRYKDFRYETLIEIGGHKIDEFSLIYCQDWLVDPSPEYYGKDIILWSQMPKKYLKIPKAETRFTYWMGLITFKDTDKWLYRQDSIDGEEKWVWREGDKPSLNNDTTMEVIEIDA